MNDEVAGQLAAALTGHTSAICALIEAIGMQAENEWRQHCGEEIAYTETAFEQLLAKHYLQGY